MLYALGMVRLLITSLVFSVAACGTGSGGRSSSTTPSAATPEQGVCNEEVYRPRGAVGTKCYTKDELDGQKRFATDTKLDPTPRQTYNN